MTKETTPRLPADARSDAPAILAAGWPPMSYHARHSQTDAGKDAGKDLPTALPSVRMRLSAAILARR